MIHRFDKLPGFQRTPAGLERKMLRLLPRIVLFGTLALAAPALFARAYSFLAPELASATLVITVDIYGIGLAMPHWLAAPIAGIAAFVVMVTKGPAAYVVDPTR